MAARLKQALDTVNSAGLSNKWTSVIGLSVLAIYLAGKFGYVSHDVVEEVLMTSVVTLGLFAKDGHK